MEQFIRDCVAIAKERWFTAQGFWNEGVQVKYTYKNLTGETLIQNAQERNVHITIERGGQKAGKRISYNDSLDPTRTIEELESLIQIPTADPAEALPEISDSFSKDLSKFKPEDIDAWCKQQYEIAKEHVEQTLQKSDFSAGIEWLIVSASWESLYFLNSMGAKKSWIWSDAGFQIGLYGNIEAASDTEWYFRDSDSLFEYCPEWTEDCIKKLEEKLKHGPSGLKPWSCMIAFAPDLAAEFLGELLGLLSGYAISEKLSPFRADEIGSCVFPEWLTVTSYSSIEHGTTVQLFDGSWITTRTIVPIKEGKLSELFLSKAAADRLSLEPNGHPHPLNVRISGKAEKSNLSWVSFVFTFLAGTHTIDSGTGNFMLEWEGYSVEKDGTLGHYVKNVGLSGNIRELFSGMVGYLDDVPDYGSTRVPTLLFKSGNIVPSQS